MGRITKSFRQQFHDELRRLTKLRNALLDLKHRDAFDTLVKVWGSNIGSMSYADIPYILDAMKLTAVIDNRKEINKLFTQIETVKSKIRDIQKQCV